MSERAARTQLVAVQERLDAHEASVAKYKRQLQARTDDLATQRAVNQQLMLKKEEVEWQLLAAIAQVWRGLVGAGCQILSVKSMYTHAALSQEVSNQQMYVLLLTLSSCN